MTRKSADDTTQLYENTFDANAMSMCGVCMHACVRVCNGISRGGPDTLIEQSVVLIKQS